MEEELKVSYLKLSKHKKENIYPDILQYNLIIKDIHEIWFKSTDLY